MKKNLNFEELFKKRNPEFAFLISRMRCAFDVEEVTFDDISQLNMVEFKKYMTDEVHNSTLKTYLAIISATVKEMAADDLCRNVDFKNINRIKCEKTENIALTEKEVELFVNYYDRIKNKKSVERDILTVFLLEIFTGARNSDCEKFDKSSINDGFLTYVSKKTHTLTRVPVHRMLPLLLARMPNKDYSRMTHCRVIKRVGERLGINKPEKRMYRGELKTRPRWMYLATHTARRTFVSLMLDKGVPLATVSKMAGHSDTAMTLRYYCSEEIILNDAAMAFFNS